MKKTQNIPKNESHQVDEELNQELNSQEALNNDGLENTAVENENQLLKEKVAELNDKFLRQAAEFENFKRRNAKERIELIQTAGRDVIVDLLDVIDDSERAQKQMDSTEDLAQIKEGISLVFSKLRNTFTANGLKPMDA
jgi:molecular chaperone GrpE